LGIKVVLIGHCHCKIGAEEAWARDQDQEQAYSNYVAHGLDTVAPSLHHLMTWTLAGRRWFQRRYL
jgi:hypothetical protein